MRTAQNTYMSVVALTGVLLLCGGQLYAQAEQVKSAPAPGNMMEFLDEKSILKTDPALSSINLEAESKTTANDHKAKIFNFEGDVRILKNGTGLWLPVQKWMTLEQGDQLRTSKNSFIEIVYDEAFLNIARIDENTVGQFRSIEPTDLFLSDGTIFSALDGLGKDGKYQVSTPVAVAAVRGTHFEVSFDAVDRTFSAATLPFEKDDHVSFIDVTEVSDKENPDTLAVQEGTQIEFQAGDSLAKVQIENVKPEIVQRNQSRFDQITNKVDAFKKLEVASAEKTQNNFSMKKDREASKKETRQEEKPGFNGPGNNNSGGSSRSDGNSAVSGTLLTTGAGENLKLNNSTFSMDRFIDKTLETQKLSAKELNQQEKDRVAPGMNNVADFLAVGGAQSGNEADQKNTISAMTALMENIGIPNDKVEQMETYMKDQYQRMENPAGMPVDQAVPPASFDPAMIDPKMMDSPGMMMDPNMMTDPNLMGNIYDPSNYIDPNMYMPKPEDLISSTDFINTETTQPNIDTTKDTQQTCTEYCISMFHDQNGDPLFGCTQVCT